MKILELQLKKDVLIVQPDERGNINSWIALHSKKWNFICLGSELTEEIASELVEEHYMNGIRSYEIYNDYRYNDSRWLDNALDSFISAVESKRFYWLKNHFEKPINFDLWRKYGDYTQYGKVLTEKCLKWQEAEEKTFRNPLIFVKE